MKKLWRKFTDLFWSDGYGYSLIKEGDERVVRYWQYNLLTGFSSLKDTFSGVEIYDL